MYISANSGHVIGRHYDVDNHHGTFQLDYQKEDILFHHQDRREPSRIPGASATETEEENESGDLDGDDLDREDSAPPMYEKHVLTKYMI